MVCGNASVVGESILDHEQHALESDRALHNFACKVAQNGWKIADVTPADGNCFFWAVSNQLATVCKETRSHQELRTAVVECMKSMPEVIFK